MNTRCMSFVLTAQYFLTSSASSSYATSSHASSSYASSSYFILHFHILFFISYASCSYFILHYHILFFTSYASSSNASSLRCFWGIKCFVTATNFWGWSLHLNHNEAMKFRPFFEEVEVSLMNFRTEYSLQFKSYSQNEFASIGLHEMKKSVQKSNLKNLLYFLLFLIYLELFLLFLLLELLLLDLH